MVLQISTSFLSFMLIVISGNDSQGIQVTKDYLQSSFGMKDLGQLSYFLGIKVN